MPLVRFSNLNVITWVAGGIAVVSQTPAGSLPPSHVVVGGALASPGPSPPPPIGPGLLEHAAIRSIAPAVIRIAPIVAGAHDAANDEHSVTHRARGRTNTR